MEINNLGAVVLFMGFAYLMLVIGWATGYKKGKSLGYARGRAVTRHASSKELSR